MTRLLIFFLGASRGSFCQLLSDRTDAGTDFSNFRSKILRSRSHDDHSDRPLRRRQIIPIFSVLHHNFSPFFSNFFSPKSSKKPSKSPAKNSPKNFFQNFLKLFTRNSDDGKTTKKIPKNFQKDSSQSFSRKNRIFLSPKSSQNLDKNPQKTFSKISLKKFQKKFQNFFAKISQIFSQKSRENFQKISRSYFRSEFLSGIFTLGLFLIFPGALPDKIFLALLAAPLVQIRRADLRHHALDLSNFGLATLLTLLRTFFSQPDPAKILGRLAIFSGSALAIFLLARFLKKGKNARGEGDLRFGVRLGLLGPLTSPLPRSRFATAQLASRFRVLAATLGIFHRFLLKFFSQNPKNISPKIPFLPAMILGFLVVTLRSRISPRFFLPNF